MLLSPSLYELTPPKHTVHTHALKDIVQMLNPSTGFIQNCNSTLYTVSGASSPLKMNYPKCMAPDGENFRGINAVKVLQQENTFTMDKLITAGYDKNLAAFEVLMPALINTFTKQHPLIVCTTLLKEPIALLKKWDYHVAENSVATTLTVEWAQRLIAAIRKVYVDED